MADAEDAHDIVFEGEQDAVVAETEAKGSGHVAVQRFDVAGARAAVMKNAIEEA